MATNLEFFQEIVRRAHQFTDAPSRDQKNQHPFEIQNIHEKLPPEVRSLFDNGHYSQATFEAFKYLDNEVQRLSGMSYHGTRLMNEAFNEVTPRINFTPCTNNFERNEQKGYKFLFAGSMLAIRNPRGHSTITDSPEVCLDHLNFTSLLLRKLEEKGCVLT